ncbi:hypothetical protein BGZ80_008824 [Entomortierella chlamydospora]|uniref:FHF complex subunit HOOK-interacting protein C-terminal domain-containing protein n=1 Tax=Entomortierella chlamydospora TaxID=101097 RepID=A0A9P6MX48_9FUNG|nr:hypothetical protein BGZ80_008824 [Entomortierella chlamydospora]
METSFWIKLKKTILTAPKAQPSSAMQLSRFNKCWLTIQAAISSSEKRNVPLQQTEISFQLKNMVDLLVDEESRLEDVTSTTGVCMEYLLKNNILTKLVNICAEGDKPRGIIGETIRTMASMINLLDDRFLVHNAVHKPTVKLLRTCCAPGTEPEGNESYHEDLIDLMYILCSKIHGYPELLYIFFYDKQWLTVPERLAARRLQRNRETMALLKSLGQRSNLALSAPDDNTSPPIATSAALGQKGDLATSDNNAPNTQAEIPPSLPIGNTTNTLPPGENEPENGQESKRDYEFLLFTYLSKFVHREGKAGDFARTGLLFLIELATGSLGEYILDSDFATYLTAGVGALYSQLPRQLIVRGEPNNSTGNSLTSVIPPQDFKPSRRSNIELSTSADFQSRLDAFLKVLEFCQDVLMRCPNPDIASSLLSSFKVVFLENILYPSILECSDTDGSSVAVISYIDQILQALEHEALVDLVVGFLMESEEDETRSKELEDSDAFAEVQNPKTTSPYFTATGRFTLKDLVLSRLKSRSQPTVIATLKLLNTIITRHCKYLVNLLSTHPDNRIASAREQLNGTTRDPYREIPMANHYTHELDLFFALIATINPHNSPEVFCYGYESYLRDAEASVETHRCLARSKGGEKQEASGAISEAERKKQRRRSTKYGHRLDVTEGQPGDAFIVELENDNMEAKAKSRCCSKGSGPGHAMQRYRLLPSDPLLQTLLGTLSHFFAHTVELNLALTGVITSLALCPHRSLEGWLLFKASDIRKPYVDREPGDESENESILEGRTGSQYDLVGLTPQANHPYDSDDEESMPTFMKGRSDSSIPSGPPSFKSFPPFFTMLRTLTQQVDYYRSEIDGFDEYLAERRRNLLFSNVNSSSQQVFTIDQLFLNKALAPGNMQTSNESFLASSGDFASGPRRPSTPTLSIPASSHPGSPASPRVSGSSDNSLAVPRASSPTPQRTMSKTPVAGGAADPVAVTKVNLTRPRKSSSPLILMSTPSNMSFLIPPGIGGRRNSKSGSTSPLTGGGAGPSGPRRLSEPATNDAESQVSPPPSQVPSRNSTTSPNPIFQPKAQRVSTQSPVSNLPKPSIFGGLATAVQGSSNTGYASGGLNSGNNQTSAPTLSSGHLQPPVGSFAITPLSKVLDTMMIKPLFSDGFVDDSDCEAEAVANLNINMGLSEDEDDEDDEEENENSSGSKSIASSDDGDEIERQANSDLQVPKKSKVGKQGRERSSSNANLNSGTATTSNSNNNRKRRSQAAAAAAVAAQEKMVSLGQLLTNVVILEEVVKEVLAVAQVRKAMGVDKVRFF